MRYALLFFTTISLLPLFGGGLDREIYTGLEITYRIKV